MDEKTEELRDIFLDVTEEETVTERQEESRGSLSGESGADREARVREVVAEMRDRFEFASSLDDDALVRVVRGYYEGESDTDIAEAVDAPRREAFRARLDLHLLRDADTDAPFDLARLRRLLADDTAVTDIADELDVSASTVRRYRRVVRARNAARQVSDRFRAAFDDIFADVAAEQLTADVKQDGLEDATEGSESESNVSF